MNGSCLERYADGCAGIKRQFLNRFCCDNCGNFNSDIDGKKCQ